MSRRWLPLALFAVLLALLAVGLTLNPREVPSPLINKPAPAFSLPQVANPDKAFSLADMKGKVWLLNVWASWCVACRQEHPLLVQFARQGVVPIVGLNYKEVRGDGELDQSKVAPADEQPMAIRRARGWLESHGDPYVTSIMDLDGRTGIDFGVYGVPETFLIDAEGVIRLKHIGPITPDVLKNRILPALEKLRG